MCLLRLFFIHQQEKNGLDWTDVIIKVLNKLNKEITDKGICKKDNPNKKEENLFTMLLTHLCLYRTLSRTYGPNWVSCL